MSCKYNRIMISGPSGYGKTTLAKWIDKEFNIPFYSGSVSDLIPKTREMSHQDMLNRDSKTLYEEDFAILNLRNKLFKDIDLFVSDRSYLDSATYFVYKQADKLPKCEVEHFLGICRQLLFKNCDCLVFLNFPVDLIDTWVTEDNNKRITNNYFQSLVISKIMYGTLESMGFVTDEFINNVSKPLSWFKWVKTREYIEYGMVKGHLYDYLMGKLPVYIINEPNLEIRKNLLHNTLSI